MEIWILQMTRKKSIIMRMKDGWQNKQPNKQTNKHTLDTNRKRAFDGKTMLGGEEHSCGRFILHSHSFLVYSTNIHNSHAPSGTMNKRTNKSKCAFCVPWSFILFCFVWGAVRRFASATEKNRSKMMHSTCGEFAMSTSPVLFLSTYD